MFGLSLSHLIIVFVVVLLFGSRRLPELGSSLGRTINSFKRGLEGKDEKEELADSSKRMIDSDKADSASRKS